MTKATRPNMIWLLLFPSSLILYHSLPQFLHSGFTDLFSVFKWVPLASGTLHLAFSLPIMQLF